MKAKTRKPRYNTRISNVRTDAAIINQEEWKRVKHDAIHLTPEQHAEIRAKSEQSRRDFMSQVQTKRSTFISSEVTPETAARTHAILNQVEERDFALRIRDRKADEELDEVKHIKSQMMAAEARNERDGQLVELTQRRANLREHEREWAEKLEANRLEALKLYEDREATLREQRRAGRRVISAQIEEHKINAILEAERRDREAKALVIQNEFIAEENRKIFAERKRRQAAFLHDCLRATAAMKEKKRADREFEKEECQMVIEVAAQKALVEAALEQEKADQRALKEREIAEIRKNQQRAMDTRAKRDEMMANKVQAEKDELARAKEQAELAYHQKLVRECKADRAMMIKEKKARLIWEAEQERIEVQKVFDNNQRAREKAKRDYERKVQLDANYRQELGESARLEWDAKQPDLKKIAKERQQILDANAEYLARVNRIRDEKLEILRKKGVAEKHLVDIKADRFELR
jgi:hypothetical protein